MAGPGGGEDGNNHFNNRQTGTRPKSRASSDNMSRNTSLTSTGASHQALMNLMREYQAVSDSLAMAREQIEREGHMIPRSGDNTRRNMRPVLNTPSRLNNVSNSGAVTRNEEKRREIELLRSRLLELEMDVSTTNNITDHEREGFNISVDSPDMFRMRSCSSNDPEDMERNLAMLTAQYEKSRQEEPDTLELSPGHLMVNNSLDRGNLSMDSSRVKSSENLEIMPPAMSLLNNTSDTVKLARELKHKRDQLQELMKKNLVSNNSVNESANHAPSSSGRVKESNRSLLGAAPVGGFRPDTDHHQHVSNPGQQLSRLQDQVTKLKQELERLSVSPAAGVTAAAAEPVSAQISQLSVSVNQLYSGLWSLQREVSVLTERINSLERSGAAGDSRDSLPSSHDDHTNTTDPWHLNNYTSNTAPPVNTAPAPGDWSHNMSWEPHQHFSPFPSRDLWNSLQASPGFNNPGLGVAMFPPNFPIMETDSGVSSGTHLNNQVSPGVRANNYYDNFRSFSRQNRLSAPQQPVASSLQHPANEPAANNNAANNGGTRPRRKYKINREQNRDSSSRVTDQQSNLRRQRAEGANPVLAANTYTSPTSETAADSLTKNIYSQVGALIQQHDQAPELLARLLQDLTLLGQQDSVRNNMNLDLEETSSFTSEDTRDARDRRPRRTSQSRSKVAGKRLTTGPQSGEDNETE